MPGGILAVAMDSVVWDLARHGYVLLAIDYERKRDGRWQPSLFAWQSLSDVTISLDVARAHPEVDQARIGLLGFSQGAVLSLLIAAEAPDRVAAVVSYYPVTDFPRWFALERSNLFRSSANEIVRWYFRRESEDLPLHGRRREILTRREKIKKRTMARRRRESLTV